MTLEQTSARLLTAAEAQDLHGVEEALRSRSEAISALLDVKPSGELAGRMTAALEDGEKAAAALRSLRQRIRMESRRLTNIQTGFVRNLGPVPKVHIDYRG